MAYEPARQRRAASEAATGRRGSIACMLFLAGMAAAFWGGAILASRAWLGW